MVRVHDWLFAGFVTAAAPILRGLADRQPYLPRARGALDRRGLVLSPRGLRRPTVADGAARSEWSRQRPLPGLPLDAARQLQFLAGLSDAEDLADNDAAARVAPADSYGPGDADVVYAMVRKLKPLTVLEVGAGAGAPAAQAAIRANAAGDPTYSCRHICIEPRHPERLERLGVDVVRHNAERAAIDHISALREHDILLINLGGAQRAHSDGLFVCLEALPQLAPGAYVQVREVYTPFGDPADWSLARRIQWSDQYLLEAFLCFNDAFEILLASNWIANQHRNKMAAALPLMRAAPDAQPSGFWMKRVA